LLITSLDGLGYEDGIVISDRLVKEDTLSSIHIEKYEAAVVETKLGPEETTRDIPMFRKKIWPIWMKTELSLLVVKWLPAIY